MVREICQSSPNGYSLTVYIFHFLDGFSIFPDGNRTVREFQVSSSVYCCNISRKEASSVRYIKHTIVLVTKPKLDYV
jgi:hypothetical protein